MSQRPMISDVEPLSGSQRDPFFGHLDLLHRDVFGSTWMPAPVAIGIGHKPIVSVGKRDVPVQQPSTVVPQVVAGKYPEWTENPLSGKATRDIESPDSVIVWKQEPVKTETQPMIQVRSVAGGRFEVTDAAGNVYRDLTRSGADTLAKELNKSGARVAPGTLPINPVLNRTTGWEIPPTKPPERTMDLGQLLNTGLDIYGRYQQLQQPKVVTVDNPYIPNVIEQFIPGQDANGNPVLIPQKKRCRRRRRRLATKSDIADLAALKQVLGGGDAFKTWIATHSR